MRKYLTLLVGVFALLIAGERADAQANYPSRPIAIIIPYATGSLTDVTARVYIDVMSEILGQPISIDYRPGAATKIGMRAIAAAAPDGYIVGITGSTTTATNVHVDPNLGYTFDSFTSIGVAISSNLVFTVNNDVPAKTVQEFIAYAKTQPGKITYASGGTGSIGNLAAELFASKAGLKLVNVPYKATQASAVDQVAGRVHMQISTLAHQSELILAGKLRGLAVPATEREPTLPNIPTFAEAGFPDYYITSTLGFIGPKGMSPDVVRKLNDAINKAGQDPRVKDKLAAMGNFTRTSKPEDFLVQVRREAKDYEPIVKALDLKVQN